MRGVREGRERTNATISLLGIGRHERKEQVFGKQIITSVVFRE